MSRVLKYLRIGFIVPLASALGLASLAVVGAAGAASTKATTRNLKPFYSQKLVWTACEDKLQCTWLTVPRSYLTRSTHGTFKIRVIKDPATGTRAQYQGALVMNPGGPGGSGYSLIKHQTISDKTLHAAYDFVSFDPRGVGKSEPAFDCGLTDKQLEALNFSEGSPRTAHERAVLVRAYGAIGQDCAAHDLNVIKWVDTASVARDIDVLRAALNESKVNWLGFSYGTKLGAVYAQLFPKRVRRMTLDGVVPTDISYFQEGIVHAQTEELGIKNYFATCAARPDCPFASNPSGGEAQLVALLASLRAHPVKVTTGRGTGIVDDGYLTTVIDEYGVGSSGDYRELDNVLAPAISKHDFGPMWNDVQDLVGRNPDGTYPDHGQHLGTFFSIKCIDGPTDVSIKQVAAAAAAAAARKINPLTGENVVWSVVNCLHWPAQTSMPPAKFKNAGQPPIMLVGSNHDFTTPLSWAASMAQQIKRSSLLRTDNVAHTSYAFGDPCVVNAVTPTSSPAGLPVRTSPASEPQRSPSQRHK